MNLRDSMLACLVALIWGVNFVVIDWGMNGISSWLFLALRFAVVAVPAVFFLARPAPWGTLLLVGAFMSLGQFGLLYSSIAVGMPPGLAALVLQAQVILTILIAAGVLGERPTPAQVVGAVVGAVGLAVVAAGRGGHVTATALLLCLAAALSWAIGNVVSRKAAVRGGLALTVWSGTVVPLPALAIALVVDGPRGVASGLEAFGWDALLSTLYTALLASLVGYGIFNTLLARHPAASVVPWILLVPPVGMTAAWVLLGEAPTALEVAGGVVMLAGVLVALRQPRRPAAVRLAPHHEPAPH